MNVCEREGESENFLSHPRKKKLNRKKSIFPNFIFLSPVSEWCLEHGKMENLSISSNALGKIFLFLDSMLDEMFFEC